MNPGIKIAGGVGVIGLVLWALTGKAKASTNRLDSSVQQKQSTIQSELAKIDSIADSAVASKNPATMRAAANTLRNTAWVYPESAAEADKAADHLVAYAQALEEQQQQQRYGTRQPGDTSWLPSGLF